jgi:hypothetical protein
MGSMHGWRRKASSARPQQNPQDPGQLGDPKVSFVLSRYTTIYPKFTIISLGPPYQFDGAMGKINGDCF